MTPEVSGNAPSSQAFSLLPNLPRRSAPWSSRISNFSKLRQLQMLEVLISDTPKLLVTFRKQRLVRLASENSVKLFRTLHSQAILGLIRYLSPVIFQSPYVQNPLPLLSSLDFVKMSSQRSHIRNHETSHRLPWQVSPNRPRVEMRR